MVGLAVAAISIGQLVTVTEPRTTAAICAQMAFVGEGAGSGMRAGQAAVARQSARG
jgi:hypothetical protein